MPYGNDAKAAVQKMRDNLMIWESVTDGNAVYVVLARKIRTKSIMQWLLKICFMILQFTVCRQVGRSKEFIS